MKYGHELQLGIMQLEREGSPPPGLRLPQAKLSRKSNLGSPRPDSAGSNPTCPASQSGLCGLRRSRCQSPISSLGRSAGCRSAAPRTARGSSGFPGLCRTCVPLEGHRDLLRRLVGSRPRCQVRWRIGFRVAGSRRILIINEAPGILHRLDQGAFSLMRGGAITWWRRQNKSRPSPSLTRFCNKDRNPPGGALLVFGVRWIRRNGKLARAEIVQLRP